MLRADYEDSTGNLNRHVGACSPPKTQESEAISAYGGGSQYSYARLRFLAAMWCARRHRPYIAVEDPEFKAILKMLYGRVDIPTRMTVSRDVQFILGDSKKRVIVLFKVSTSRDRTLIAADIQSLFRTIVDVSTSVLMGGHRRIFLHSWASQSTGMTTARSAI